MFKLWDIWKKNNKKFLHHETNNIQAMLVMRNIYWELTIVKYYA